MNDITSTIDGSKWFHNVSASDLTRLTGLADQISSLVQTVVSEATKAQIKIGRLLLEARDVFPGDEQFGKWRAEHTPIKSKESANKLMNLAKHCGEGRLTEELVNGLPISTLKELLTAPDSVIQAVVERVQAGDPPSKNETREMVRETRESTMLEDLQALDNEIDLERAGVQARQKAKIENIKGPSAPLKPLDNDYNNRLNAVDKILKKKMADRIAYLAKDKTPYGACIEIEWAWMVFGLDPAPASLHTREVIDVLYDYYIEQLSGPFIKNIELLVETVEQAKLLIEEEYACGS